MRPVVFSHAIRYVAGSGTHNFDKIQRLGSPEVRGITSLSIRDLFICWTVIMDIFGIAEFIRSNWLVLMIVLFGGVLFWAFRPKNKNNARRGENGENR
jgi:cbb3-type cytochrome oxidase subunit 3